MDCPDFQVSQPGSKRCAHYLDTGHCGLISRASAIRNAVPSTVDASVCVVWQAKHPGESLPRRTLLAAPPAAALLAPPPGRSAPSPGLAKAPPAAQETSGPPSALVLTPEEPPTRPRAAQAARAEYVRGSEGLGLGVEIAGVGGATGRSADERDAAFERHVAELEALGPEVEVATDYGPMTLVRAPTGAPRREVTFRAMAQLVRVLEVFPGSRVTGWKDAPKETKG